MPDVSQLRLKTRSTLIFFIFMAILGILMFAKPALSCDVAVVSAKASSTGRPILWKNFDCSSYWKQEVKYFKALNPKAGDYMLLFHFDDYMLQINKIALSPQSGTNAAGFACSVAAVYEDMAPEHEANNLNTDVIRHAVQTCATVADFENLLKNWTKSHPDNPISANYVVVDARGGAALYEVYTGDVTKGPLVMQFRRYDANDGSIVNESGKVIKGAQADFPGFVTRTNINNYIWYNSGYDRYVRANKLFNDLAIKNPVTGKTRLNADNIMRLVAKDVTGKQIDVEKSSPTNYSLTYCISRNATRSATVFEGVAPGDDPRRSIYWTALGEPSIAVFVPNMIGAKRVSDYVFMDTIIKGKMYDKDESSLLCRAEDELETYKELLHTSNRGSVVTGPFNKTINKVELAKVQKWTFPIEDTIIKKTHDLLDKARTNPKLLEPKYLAAFTNYCGKYAYQNYVARSAKKVPWKFVAPDGKVDNKQVTSSSVQPSNKDLTPPSGSISFIPELPTSGPVVATLTTNEPVTMIGGTTNTHTFTKNGSYTFKFMDAAGNVATATADVYWIVDQTYTDAISKGINSLFE